MPTMGEKHNDITTLAKGIEVKTYVALIGTRGTHMGLVADT